MNEVQMWVLLKVRERPATAGGLIAAANGVLFLKSQTSWRKVDRAIQFLRRAELIRFNGRKWHATAKGRIGA